MTRKNKSVLISITLCLFALLVSPLAEGTPLRNPFVGTYTRTYMGATREMKEVLVLRRNMTCTLTTSYPTSTYFKPWSTSGTWTTDGSTAHVSMKWYDETERMTFVLRADRLVATEYRRDIWGEDLKYERVKHKR